MGPAKLVFFPEFFGVNKSNRKRTMKMTYKVLIGKPQEK